MEQNIWFLLLSLFCPRLVLFFWWLAGNLPHNTTPFIADLFASILVPRILILVWIYQTAGICPWFWIHFIVMIVVWILSSVRVITVKNQK